ncbi:restriction endonuclease subunit S [Clostridium botulinum]|uniref:Restriction modification system DNA specificity domain protein n=2 Tax=Clostridium botulinum TaxID=1491 RepID=C1FPX8_CLOBJ|nr:restriction endonuclease subunit S [Clostridium botulinum]ACO83607.1 restriction modification system DNA specificity domain protein [Clostridium botulinum A2 str. Kyoto]AUN07222.1 hypothetical protein RSJ14_11130 [Clostridium botulinum]
MTRKMKDSGVEWIGYMNTCWKTMPLKFILKERRQKNSPIITKERLSLSIGVGVTLYSEKTTNLDRFKDDVTQYKVAYPNDLVINSMNVIVGAEGISNYLGCVSPAYYVMCSSNPQKFITKYYDYCFKTSTIQKALFYLGKGIMAIDRGEGRVNTCRLKVSSYDLGRLEFPVPSVNEQHRIVEFLDNRCNKIDQTIQKEKQVIEKLKEYKQSVITEAVTKGLNPDVKMKDSGVEWIGEIPKHWKVEKLKHIFSFKKGLSITKDNLVEEGIKVISYGQIHSKSNIGVCINDSLIRYVGEEYLETGKQSLVLRNDFIFADTSEDLEGAGNYVYVGKNEEIFAGYHTIILTPIKDDIMSEWKYFAYLYKTDCWRSQIRSRVSGIKLFSITQKILKQTEVIVPDIKEQKEITDYLDKKCSSIDKLISDKEKVIKKLTEYKKSLIYECVTGKKEVQ